MTQGTKQPRFGFYLKACHSGLCRLPIPRWPFRSTSTWSWWACWRCWWPVPSSCLLARQRTAAAAKRFLLPFLARCLSYHHALCPPTHAPLCVLSFPHDVSQPHLTLPWCSPRQSSPRECSRRTRWVKSISGGWIRFSSEACRSMRWLFFRCHRSSRWLWVSRLSSEASSLSTWTRFNPAPTCLSLSSGSWSL